MRKYIDIINEANELRYPNGEVHHTEYDAPEDGARVRETATGREGVMVGSEPSHHGSDYAPDVFVAFDDEQEDGREQYVARLTLDDIEPVMTESNTGWPSKMEDDPFEIEFFYDDPDGEEDRAGEGYYFRLTGEETWSGAWHSEDEAEEEAWDAIEQRKADAERAAARAAAQQQQTPQAAPASPRIPRP
jgi:hypothetical protein